MASSGGMTVIESDLCRIARQARDAQAAGRRRRAAALWSRILSETPQDRRGEPYFEEAAAYTPDFGRILAANPRRRIYLAGCGRSGTWYAFGIMGTFAGTYLAPEERHFGHFATIAGKPQPVHVVKRIHYSHQFLPALPGPVGLLYVLRDPRDVLTSVHNGTKYYISLERWSLEMKALRTLLDAERPDMLTVRFEDLVLQPRQEQVRIAEAFGLEIAAEPTAFHQNFRVDEFVEKAMQGLRAPDPSVIGRWRRNTDHVEYIRRLMPAITDTFQPIADRFGYDLARDV
jgi:hypothetical protein